MSNGAIEPGAEQSEVNVEVAYALPDKQRIIALKVNSGCSPYAAAKASKIEQEFPGLSLEDAKMGVFGKAVDVQQYELREGDRVEIYRPLQIDPKQARRDRAAKAQPDVNG